MMTNEGEPGFKDPYIQRWWTGYNRLRHTKFWIYCQR